MSWQLTLTQFALRYGVNPWFKPPENIQLLRRNFADMMKLAPQPHGVKVLKSRDESLWVIPEEEDAKKAILYFHGGGYIYGSPSTHEVLLRRLALFSKVMVFAPAYPLAPEQRAPAQHRAGLEAWTQLRNQGLAASDILIAGDSAGGGLALSLLSSVLQTGERPAGALVFSPWVDMALTGSSYDDNARLDTFLPADRMEDHVKIVAPGLDPKDPRISPLYADFPDCPPVMFHCSGTEILRDDTVAMARRLKGFGSKTQSYTVMDAPHVWHLMDGWLPEARESLKMAAGFARNALNLRA